MGMGDTGMDGKAGYAAMKKLVLDRCNVDIDTLKPSYELKTGPYSSYAYREYTCPDGSRVSIDTHNDIFEGANIMPAHGDSKYVFADGIVTNNYWDGFPTTDPNSTSTNATIGNDGTATPSGGTSTSTGSGGGTGGCEIGGTGTGGQGGTSTATGGNVSKRHHPSKH